MNRTFIKINKYFIIYIFYALNKKIIVNKMQTLKFSKKKKKNTHLKDSI